MCVLSAAQYIRYESILLTSKRMRNTLTKMAAVVYFAIMYLFQNITYLYHVIQYTLYKEQGTLYNV